MAISRALLGKRLKSAREKKGYKQAYIAEVVDLSPNQISRIENGARSVYVDKLSAWCDLLEVSMIEILAEAEATQHPSHGRVFDEITRSSSEKTVLSMLEACRIMADIECRSKEE